MELELVTDSLRAASCGADPDGLNPTLRMGEGENEVLNCMGETGEMTLRPSGVIDPRRG